MNHKSETAQLIIIIIIIIIICYLYFLFKSHNYCYKYESLIHRYMQRATKKKIK